MSTRDSEGDGFRVATLEFLESLYGAALRLTRNADRAQDLLQDRYLKAIRAAEATLKQEFDLIVRVPPSLAAEKLELMAVRRCLYGDGRAAHLMYRLHGEPVSLFIVPGVSRPARVASYLRNEAQ